MLGHKNGCHRGDVEQTSLYEKLARCFVIHSSYRVGVRGEYVSGSFATRSITAGGATSRVISRYRSRQVGAFDLRKPIKEISVKLFQLGVAYLSRYLNE